MEVPYILYAQVPGDDLSACTRRRIAVGGPEKKIWFFSMQNTKTVVDVRHPVSRISCDGSGGLMFTGSEGTFHCEKPGKIPCIRVGEPAIDIVTGCHDSAWLLFEDQIIQLSRTTGSTLSTIPTTKENLGITFKSCVELYGWSKHQLFEYKKGGSTAKFSPFLEPIQGVSFNYSDTLYIAHDAWLRVYREEEPVREIRLQSGITAIHVGPTKNPSFENLYFRERGMLTYTSFSR